MADLRQIVRRDSRCPRQDFIQRIRAGILGTLIITILMGGYHWIMH